MLRFVVLVALTITSVYASGYGAVGGLGLSGGFGYGGGLGLRGGLGYGGGLGLSGGLGYGGGLGLATGFAGGYHGYAGIIPAAIQSTRSYEVVPVPLHYEAPIPQTIDIPPNVQPINMIFRTASSPLNVQQIHTPAAPQFESTRSEDEASILTHESYKPVIQKYLEVIQPFRQIEQRVQPVIENVHTVVAKGEEYHAPLALAAPIASGYGNGLALAGGYGHGDGLALGGGIGLGAGLLSGGGHYKK